MVGISNAATTATIIKDGDLNMGAYDIKTDDIKESTVNNGVDIDGVVTKDNKIRTLSSIEGAVVTKKVSDVLKNSHDVEVDTASTGVSYVKVKTMTFTYGIKGNLRVKFDWKSNNGSYTVYGRIYKNGVALGTADGGVNTTYQTFSEDIDVGTIAAGETLELWGKAEHASAHVLLQHFRCYYDDTGDAATVVNS
jgi:hypothetical protein